MAKGCQQGHGNMVTSAYEKKNVKDRIKCETNKSLIKQRWIIRQKCLRLKIFYNIRKDLKSGG